jgi:hypothetical protein
MIEKGLSLRQSMQEILRDSEISGMGLLSTSSERLNTEYNLFESKQSS